MTNPDPLGAIERLTGADAPWLHLLDGAPADARQLAWLLAERGAVTRILRGYCMRTRFGLYDEIGAALQLPGDAIEDWEGLQASLTDMPWLPGRAHVLVVTSAALTLSADAAESARLWESLVAVGQRRTGEIEVGNPLPFHVVLADDAPGLALLRARLAQAGVQFDTVADWEAQEPAVVRDRGVRTSFVADSHSRPESDERAAAAVRDRGEVLSLARACERFRGAHTSDTVVYGAVINRFDDVPALTTALAGAVAEQGAQIMVVSDIEAARTPRQREFLAAATAVWPEPETPEPAEPEPEPESVDSAEDVPAQVRPSSAPGGEVEPNGKFEIVAANLEWAFRSGAAEPDAVDEAIVAEADADEHIRGVWRCWCKDPRRDQWIRVLMSIVDGDSATVDDSRKRLVGALESGGATRCCVEVVGAADAGEAHEWLQEQSVCLFEAEAAVSDMDEPTDQAEPEPETRAEPGTEEPAPDEPEIEPARAVEQEPAVEPDGPAALAANTNFTAGPSDPGEGGQRLVEWAETTPAVVGLVNAVAEDGAHSFEVYGVVVGEGDHDLDEIEEQARAAFGPADPEPQLVAFAPSRKLDQVHLALYRGGNRLWRRAVERPAASQGTGFKYTKLSDFQRLEMQVGELENGVTLVEINQDWELTPDPAEPSDADTAVIEWAKGAEHVIGLARGIGSRSGARTRIYTVMLDALAGEPPSAEAIADCVASHEVPQLTVLSFCPFASISMFHQDVFRQSLLLWKTDEDLTPEQMGEAPAEPAQACDAETGETEAPDAGTAD